MESSIIRLNTTWTNKKKRKDRSSGGIQHAWITSGHHSDLKAGNILQKGKKNPKRRRHKRQSFLYDIQSCQITEWVANSLWLAERLPC